MKRSTPFDDAVGLYLRKREYRGTRPRRGGRQFVRRRVDNATLNTAFSNCFGFGGTNASLVFQNYRKLIVLAMGPGNLPRSRRC